MIVICVYLCTYVCVFRHNEINIRHIRINRILNLVHENRYIHQQITHIAHTHTFRTLAYSGKWMGGSRDYHNHIHIHNTI